MNALANVQNCSFVPYQLDQLELLSSLQFTVQCIVKRIKVIQLERVTMGRTSRIQNKAQVMHKMNIYKDPLNHAAIII